MATPTPELEDFKLRNLRGAVVEYLDDDALEDFFRDLRKILEDEEDGFQKKADIYKKARRSLFSKT